MNHAYRDPVTMLSPDSHALVARAEAIFAETRETGEALAENILWNWELRQQTRDLKAALREDGCRLRRLRQQVAAACGQPPAG